MISDGLETTPLLSVALTLSSRVMKTDIRILLRLWFYEARLVAVNSVMKWESSLRLSIKDERMCVCLCYYTCI